MGNAGTALADGPTAAYWNPGALGWQCDRPVLEMMPLTYTSLVAGIDEDVRLYSAAVAGATRSVGLGFSLNYLDYGPRLVAGDPGPSDPPHPREYTLHMGAGADVGRLFLGAWPWLDWGLGFSWKHLYADLLYFWGTRTDAAGADDLEIGTLIAVTKRLGGTDSSRPSSVSLRLGAVLDNVFDNEISFPDAEMTKPLGKSHRLSGTLVGDLGKTPLGPLLHLQATWEMADLMGKATSVPVGSPGDDRIFGYGFEAGLLRHFTFRLGYVDNDPAEIHASSWGFSLGGDLHPRFGARVDFANSPQFNPPERTETFSFTGWGRF